MAMMGKINLALRGSARIAAAEASWAPQHSRRAVSRAATRPVDRPMTRSRRSSSPASPPTPVRSRVREEVRGGTGVAVEVLHEGYPTFHDKLLTTLSSGAATYDVIMSAYQWTGEFAPFLVPLTEQIDGDDSLLGRHRVRVGELCRSTASSTRCRSAPRPNPCSTGPTCSSRPGSSRPPSWDDFQKVAGLLHRQPGLPRRLRHLDQGQRRQLAVHVQQSVLRPGRRGPGEPGSTLDVDLAAQALDLLRTAETEYSPAGSLQATFTEVSAQFTAGTVAMAELMPTTVLGQITPETPDNKVYGNVGVDDHSRWNG